MKFKNSLRLQLALIFIAMTSICVLISMVVSNTLLVRYYRARQINDLKEYYADVNRVITSIADDEADASGEIGNAGKYEEVRPELDSYSAQNNLTICIIDASAEGGVVSSVYFSSGINQLSNVLESMHSYIINGSDEASSDSSSVFEGDKFDIYKTRDNYTQNENYDLVGLLDGGDVCLIRLSYSRAEDAALVANNFFAYVSLGVIFFEALIIIVILRKITKPLLTMNTVARRMTNLDFDARAEVNTNNEIGQLAESLNTLSGALEQKIVELKSANNELKTDLEKRAEIDEMRKDFLGNVSHELKTPIAIIRGYAEGLKDNVNEDPESRDFYCDVIMDEAEKMNDMVKKIISLNRMEYGEYQPDFGRFNITELVAGVLKNSEILAAGRDIKVEFDDSRAYSVYADEFMIEECVTNFISNAYNHVAGENIIRVSLEKRENKLRLSVYNSGSHIPEDELDKVWIKFYKVDKARTREYGGSGIGLSIVKAIIERHHEECGVYNTEDGVVFYFDMDCGNE